MKLNVELVWEAEEGQPSSAIHLTSDGRILLEGTPVGEADRRRLSLPKDRAFIGVDTRLVDAIKTFL